jgi:hypothetical protein
VLGAGAVSLGVIEGASSRVAFGVGASLALVSTALLFVAI